MTTTDDLGVLAASLGGQVPQFPNISSNALTPDDDARRKVLLEAALGYARHGWRVIPVRWITPEGACACYRGTECPSPGKHPVHDDWPNVATCEPQDVATWWRPEAEGIAREWFPFANIGIVTGRGSGIFVLDVDVKRGKNGDNGYDTLAKLELRHGDLPETRVHHTGSGGRHYFFRHPGFTVRDSVRRRMGEGLDVKGIGFVVAPPSVSAKGLYELNPAQDIEPADAPAWLLDMLRDGGRTAAAAHSGYAPAAESPEMRSYAGTALRNEATRVRDAAPGERNDTLNRAAFALGTLGGAGLLAEDEAWNALHDAGTAAGLGTAETYATFQSGWNKGMENPRQIEPRRAAVEANADADAEEITDAHLAARFAAEVLKGDYCRVPGLGWLGWRGGRWASATDEELQNVANEWLLSEYRWFVAESSPAEIASKNGAWLKHLDATHVRGVVALAAGYVLREAAEFDAHPDLLNCANGVVDLRTGELRDHDSALLMTKITRGRYRPGYRHPDWDKALQALAPDERVWYQNRIGQAITGHRTPDGVMPVLQGGGENGKTLLTTDGLVPALGDYADVASPKLVATDRPGRSEHSTERADLRGQRLLIGEELSEGRSLDVTALKRIMDVSHIKARHVHKDNFTFAASHSLFVTTNYVPVVSETDHGTWRRLVLLKFPYSYRKNVGECVRPTDRIGDPTIKLRVQEGTGGQHDAIVTWAVEGSLRWYADPTDALTPTDKIAADTLRWRITADRILAFWTERLIADPGADGAPAPCILAEEMTETFNLWLKGNGHEQWSRETFTPRFAEHQETTRHGVERRRTAALANVSRRPLDGSFSIQKATPKQAYVWTRVRFRTEADQHEDREVAQVAQSLPNISRVRTREHLVAPVQPMQPNPPERQPGVSGLMLPRTPTDDPASCAFSADARLGVLAGAP